MREPCRILIRYNTQFDYGKWAMRLVRRTVRQQAMPDRYEGIHTGVIRANKCELMVFRLDGWTEWTSMFDHVVLLGGFRFKNEELKEHSDGSH